MLGTIIRSNTKVSIMLGTIIRSNTKVNLKKNKENDMGYQDEIQRCKLTNPIPR
jgi:hypothetical protein